MAVSHEEVVRAAQAEQILTSDVFKEEDYIRSYDAFLETKN